MVGVFGVEPVAVSEVAGLDGAGLDVDGFEPAVDLEGALPEVFFSPFSCAQDEWTVEKNVEKKRNRASDPTAKRTTTANSPKTIRQAIDC